MPDTTKLACLAVRQRAGKRSWGLILLEKIRAREGMGNGGVQENIRIAEEDLRQAGTLASTDAYLGWSAEKYKPSEPSIHNPGRCYFKYGGPCLNSCMDALPLLLGNQGIIQPPQLHINKLRGKSHIINEKKLSMKCYLDVDEWEALTHWHQIAASRYLPESVRDELALCQ
ncbi:uncharacterized protein CLUP02_01689 [Colletotrichum lupini]|uniref:Uncharacterized protein n=1 Tax=Colletotrichum lupini TaxID=145971 RepID=A0A9Q8W9J0_9PEZI|nr:uncharacterized protein CLUP02_01689 [Colletotrichum lupini]UQC75036.1 hypothetical protein CLUP02_01689 [Colletotrichum lupini]